MTTVKLVLDKRRKKKSGAYPLVIRIRLAGKYVDVATKLEKPLILTTQKRIKVTTPNRSILTTPNQSMLTT
jgi:hypothetical protein